MTYIKVIIYAKRDTKDANLKATSNRHGPSGGFVIPSYEIGGDPDSSQLSTCTKSSPCNRAMYKTPTAKSCPCSITYLNKNTGISLGNVVSSAGKFDGV